jgi:hypothetical protein
MTVDIDDRRNHRREGAAATVRTAAEAQYRWYRKGYAPEPQIGLYDRPGGRGEVVIDPSSCRNADGRFYEFGFDKNIVIAGTIAVIVEQAVFDERRQDFVVAAPAEAMDEQPVLAVRY